MLSIILQYIKDALSDIKLKFIQLGLIPMLSIIPEDKPILKDRPDRPLSPYRELPDPVVDNTPPPGNETYSRKNKIWKNYYDTTIGMITSPEKRNSLYRLIDRQINNKIINLPEDIIKERMAYAYVIAGTPPKQKNRLCPNLKNSITPKNTKHHI